MADPGAGEWWADYFDEDFVALYRPFLPPERTLEEAAGAAEMLGLERGDRVLDLACGWGRHSLELAAAGARVTGLDRSAHLLEVARRAALQAGRRVAWVRADMRRLPFREAFDAAVSLFSSLGYFGSDAADLEVLRGVRRALRPGGRFLLETMHRDQVAREFVERDWWPGADGAHVWVEREFDAVAGVSHERLRWRRGRRSGEKRHSIRVRSATEWAALLEDAGLRPESWFGDWDLSPFELGSERLVVVARRGD